LLKQKYSDTVTIDVEMLLPNPYNNHINGADDDEDILDVGMLGQEGTMVNMSQFIHIP